MEYPTEFPEFFIAHRAGGAIYKNFNHSQLIFEVKRLKVWPDCIGPWASHGPLLFSERVVASAQESGVSGLIARRAKLEFLKAKTQNPTDPPWDYYAIEVSGEMDFAIEVFERIESKGAILGYKRRYVTKNCDDPRLRYCAQGFFNYKRFLLLDAHGGSSSSHTKTDGQTLRLDFWTAWTEVMLTILLVLGHRNHGLRRITD